MTVAGYSPLTAAERAAMLSAIGLEREEQLFDDIPMSLRAPAIGIPRGLGEMGAMRRMEEMAGKNRAFRSVFRGAGAYRHYIPAIVKSVAAKEEFLTAYTPYQPEISQGTLQAIFEYQTMICELTGMDASNASVYDGATAAAEAIAMCRERKKTVALISASANPMTIETIRTYCEGAGTPYELIGLSPDGHTDIGALKTALGAQTACVYFESPNFYGQIEDGAALCTAARAAGAKAVMGVNPIACALYKTPGELGADIAVGEGQPLGMPLGFGGPYLGFMAARAELLRKLPGRIVGQTEDNRGNRAFVLTLQAREQHIRREKASSNICSNQALCAVTAAAYLAAMGPGGLYEVARQCHDKAVYLSDAICALDGYERVFGGAFFHEFVTSVPGDPQIALDALAEKGILGGLPVERGILWCATEMNTRAEMDELAAALREVRW